MKIDKYRWRKTHQDTQQKVDCAKLLLRTAIKLGRLIIQVQSQVLTRDFLEAHGVCWVWRSSSLLRGSKEVTGRRRGALTGRYKVGALCNRGK